MSHPQVPLSDLCHDIVVGHVGPSSKHRDSDGIPFLMGKNIGPGYLKLDSLERVSRSFHEREKKSQLRPGDIVVVRIGQSGQAALIPNGFDEANCSGLVVIKKPLESVYAPYLVYYLNSPQGRSASLREAKGSTRSTLNTSSVSKALIPLPPLEEQRRIAAILDKTRSIQNLVKAREESLGSFEESLFNHLFGSTHEQQIRWEWVQFGSLCSRLTVGVVVKPASYYRETGVPALRSLNVKPGQVVETNLVYISEEHNDGILSKSRLSCGDLVFVRSGRPGTCAVIPPSLDGCNAIDLLLATTDSARILPGFASSYFNSAGGRASVFAESRGQVQQHFNAGSLASALVPVPPIEIQEEFCNTLKARNAQLTKCEFSIESLNALSKALENSLMSGNHR